MSDNVKSVVFALATAIICSLLLTAASSGLKPFQQENIEVDRKKNILKSIGLIEDDRAYTFDTIKSLFADNITSMVVNDEGRVVEDGSAVDTTLPIYLYTQDETIKAYVLPINTRGLWGKIHGYLALESDGSTVSGFSVYQHSETPGLGGRSKKAGFKIISKASVLLIKAALLCLLALPNLP